MESNDPNLRSGWSYVETECSFIWHSGKCRWCKGVDGIYQSWNLKFEGLSLDAYIDTEIQILKRGTEIVRMEKMISSGDI